jgi:ABC-type branched-subunit amino acid transport system substrate-binding protein
LTGPYTGLGKNELIGCELAVEQINAKGGVLGRKVALVVEDSSSGDAGTAVEKARKLIDSDKVDFLLGNVNSALSLAMAQVSNEKRILRVVPDAHTDAITGSSCHWNVFRVCNATQTLAFAVAGAIIKNYGKNWYYITPDYAYGHTLEAGMVKAAAALGGSRVGGDLTPLGTADFSSYLIKAQAASPDVIIFLTQGNDMVNALKQAVQFGPQKKLHLAGAEQSLEALEGLPPEARMGTWVMEWYWRQPDAPPRRGVRRRNQEALGPYANRAHLARFRCRLDMRACGKQGPIARCGRDGQGFTGVRVAAGGWLDAQAALLPSGAESAHPRPLCWRCAGKRRGTRRLLQGDLHRQQRGCRRYGRRQRLRDEVAWMKRLYVLCRRRCSRQVG